MKNVLTNVTVGFSGGIFLDSSISPKMLAAFVDQKKN